VPIRSARLAWLVCCAAANVFLAPCARAQDPFEIHVYEYEMLRPGEFTLETHLNYVGSGAKDFEGPIAPF
jgi:hypothetical protein